MVFICCLCLKCLVARVYPRGEFRLIINLKRFLFDKIQSWGNLSRQSLLLRSWIQSLKIQWPCSNALSPTTKVLLQLLIVSLALSKETRHHLILFTVFHGDDIANRLWPLRWFLTAHCVIPYTKWELSSAWEHLSIALCRLVKGWFSDECAVIVRYRYCWESLRPYRYIFQSNLNGLPGLIWNCRNAGYRTLHCLCFERS